MSVSELAQLETLAQIDRLVESLGDWATRPSPWQSIREAQQVLSRLMARLDTLRLRMDSPLVVATLGGTGVGKSSLVNALIGEEIAMVGRQRPTTTRPTVIAHHETNLAPYHLPLDDLQVVQRNARVLRDWLIIDCPDPDTSESDESGSNIAQLRRILPYCDVLLYVSTQQKYRSAKVGQELAQAADGCKVIFVQTHADHDSDIRADWRAQLEPAYRVSEMFFVDSRTALREQKQGLRPSGDFGRLLDVLLQELSAVQRVRIRQGNLFGLVHAALEHGEAQLKTVEPAIRELQELLQQQRARLTRSMAVRLEAELLASRGLWERRLLGDIAQRWGLSPFSLVLRAWHSQASLLASYTLMRSRNTAQMALWGAVHGTRWLATRTRELRESQDFEQPPDFQTNAAELREAQLIVEGHARAAGLPREIVTDAAAKLGSSMALVEEEFWGRARQRLDAELATAAVRHSQPSVRLIYEVGFALLPLWLLFRVGKNFFYDSWWLEKPLLETNFYIPALLFLALWIVAAVMLFTSRLRRGLERSVQAIAGTLAESHLSAGLFPAIDRDCQNFHEELAQLQELRLRVMALRQQVVDTPGLSQPRLQRAAEFPGTK